VEYKNLTFTTMKDPFLWGVYSPAESMAWYKTNWSRSPKCHVMK
jgi:hypothetical protein